MARFLTSLHVNQVNDGEWLLLRDLVYESDVLKDTICVPIGFQTDFASVPRLPGAYLVAGGKATKEAVIHDYLYATGLCSRKDADAVFLEAMQVNGQSWWRRTLMWAAVRAFGGFVHNPKEAS